MPRSLALLSVTMLAFAGCTANIPDGRFHCVDDNGCPNGLHCHADRLCYHAADDAGPGGDTGADAAMPMMDTGPVDSGACTASDCITLTVTNAYGTFASGLTFTIEGGGFTMPAYGETSNAFDVSLGDGMLDIMSTVLGTSLSFPATGHSSYALVVGHDPSPSNITPVLRLLPVSFVAPTAGTFRVYPIDLMQESATLVLSADGTPHRIDPATDGGVLMLTSGKRTPIELNRFAMDGTTPDVMLAAYDASELPQMGAYYAVLVGNPSVHLGADGGLRIIPVVPGLHLTPSWPVVFTLNVSTDPITLCNGSSPVATVIPMMMQQGLPSFGPLTPAGMGATIMLSPTDCSDPAARPVTLPAPTAAEVSGRVLLAIEGIVPTMWGGGAHLEAPPSTTGAAQVVTYGNGSISASAGFGSTATGIRAASTPPLGVAFLEWGMMPPSDLTVSYGGLTYAYPWIPASESAALFWITDDSTMHVAFELDSPFGQSWIVNMRVPH